MSNLEKLPQDIPGPQPYENPINNVLTDTDRRWLKEGVPGVMEKLLARFNGTLPDAIIYIETSARPLHNVFAPIFNKLSQKLGVPKPNVYFFNASGSDNKLSRSVEKDRATEIKQFIKNSGRDPKKIAVIDDFGMTGEAQEEVLKAFGSKKIPYFYVAAEDDSWPERINQNTVGTFVGSQGNYAAGRYGWWVKPGRDISNPEEFEKNRVGVFKEQGRKYASALRLQNLQERDLTMSLADRLYRKLIPFGQNYKREERAHEIAKMTAGEQSRLTDEWEKYFSLKLKRFVEIYKMTEEELSQLTDQTDKELAEIAAYHRLWNSPLSDDEKKKEEKSFLYHREKVVTLRKQLKNLGEKIAEEYMRKHYE